MLTLVISRWIAYDGEALNDVAQLEPLDSLRTKISVALHV